MTKKVQNSARDYKPQEIEAKWQKIWGDKKTFSPNLKEAKNPYYNLMMFPYPSAEGLHVGNMYAFTGTDIWGKYQRMNGKDVFEPIGLDGFGIHSENYAIKIGAHPVPQAQVTKKRFYEQLKSTGNGFAWDHTLETYDPLYYRWTQWVFVQMFKHGLAYRKKAEVNWCPSCKTVLADEQVINEKCERCSSVVEKKNLEQWFFKITNYADRLLTNLDTIDWAEKVKIAQRNWIGKSTGAEVRFKIDASEDEISVFTTRPDTLYGVTFLSLSIDSPWVQKLTTEAQKADVESYIKSNKTTSNTHEDKDKSGVFTGNYVINPANQEKIPVYISNYVLSGYGSGAVMGVPAHDQRDLEFAKKYNIEIRPVIRPVTGEVRDNEEYRKSIVAIVRNPGTNKYLSINWGDKLGGNLFIGGGIEEGEDIIEAAKREIKEETGYKNVKFVSQTEPIEHHYFAASKNVNRKIEATGLYFELENEEQENTSLEESEKGKFTVEWVTQEEASSKVHDALHKLVFEQLALGKSYSGSGILINSGEWTNLEMPRQMGEVIESIEKAGFGKSKVTYHLRDWLISRQRYWGPPIPMIFCEKCEAEKKGDREDMPGWYTVPEENLPVELPYIENFKPVGTGEGPLAQDHEWMAVSCPACGSQARRETDVSDTFLDSAWYFLRYPSTQDQDHPWDPEITKKWLPVDMYIGGAEHSVLHLLYSRFVTMAFKDWGLLSFEEPFTRFYAHGLIIKDGAKMSKSKGNVIVPDTYIQKFGADTLRTYLMFLGPYDLGGDFRDTGIEGMYRFLKRVWVLASQETQENQGDQEKKLRHKAIKRVTEDMGNLRYNRAIAGIMEYVNSLEELRAKMNGVSEESLKTLMKLLAPFASHMAEEVWEMMGEEESIHLSSWPTFDPKLLEEDSIEIAVQVNGKLRGTVEVQMQDSKDESAIVDLAKKDERIVKYLTSEPKKTIYIPGKLINFVV